MAYLLYQIWLCLLVTAFIAGILGWLLRGGGKSKLQDLNTQWQDKYDTLSQERNSYATKINKLSGISHEKKRLENKISTQKRLLNQSIDQLNQKLADSENEIQQQQTLLAQKDEEIVMSMMQLDNKILEAEDDRQTYQSEIEKELTTV
jgi:outer membrane murein-binding lipoprotein Lpp